MSQQATTAKSSDKMPAGTFERRDGLRVVLLQRATRVFFALFRTAIGVGLLIYLGTSGAMNWSKLLGLLWVWPMTLLALLLLFVDLVVTSWRLCLLMRPQGLHLSLASSVRLSLIGIFFNACLPSSAGGDVVKIYYAIQGQHGRRTQVATVMLFDRVVGLCTLLGWPLLLAPFFSELLASLPVLRTLLIAAAATVAVIVSGILLCFSARIRNSQLLSWAFRRLPLGNYFERMVDVVRAYRKGWAALLSATLASLLAHTLTVGVTLLAAFATNPRGFSWKMTLLIPLGQLANILPLTPGGLGVGEAAFNQLFRMAGLVGGAEAMLGLRLLMIFLSLLGLAFYLQGRRCYIRSASEEPHAPRPQF